VTISFPSSRSVEAGVGIKATCNDGETPLILAATYDKNCEVITKLLKAGAKLEAREPGGRTPLLYAAETNQNPEVIATLLKDGAGPKEKNRAGKTAFDYAQNNKKLIGTDALKQLEKASK